MKNIIQSVYACYTTSQTCLRFAQNPVLTTLRYKTTCINVIYYLLKFITVKKPLNSNKKAAHYHRSQNLTSAAMATAKGELFLAFQRLA